MNWEPLGSALILRRIRWMTTFFIVALVLSGATAIPLEAEMDWLIDFGVTHQLFDPSVTADAPGWAQWLIQVQTALHDTNARYPFITYGADWLAFGHFVIAIAFLGAWRDPLRNRWLFSFGMIACALVVPYALLFGAVREIPIYWRLIDSSFGVFGFIPLWLCHRWARELERTTAQEASAEVHVEGSRIVT